MNYFDPYENRAEGQYPEGMPVDTKNYLFPSSHQTLDDFSLGETPSTLLALSPTVLLLGVVSLGLYFAFKK